MIEAFHHFIGLRIVGCYTYIPRIHETNQLSKKVGFELLTLVLSVLPVYFCHPAWWCLHCWYSSHWRNGERTSWRTF